MSSVRTTTTIRVAGKSAQIKGRSAFGAFHPNIMLRHRSTFFSDGKPSEDSGGDLSDDDVSDEANLCSDPDGLGQAYCWED